jgi:CheY-like chemotaxis protein
MLDISRIGHNELTLRKEPTDLGAVVRRATETVDHLIRERHQTLSIELAESVTLVEADPVRLEQIFVNLLSNASKYTPARGSIDVSVEIDGDHARVHVRDTGLGIPRGMEERIFEPFVQANNGGKAADGLGIGLAITQYLVKLHDGKISVESTPGRGSTFSVTLPLLRTKQPALRSLPAGFAPHNALDLSVVVVDDNRTAADTLVKLLARRGYEASALYSGDEALREIPVRMPDLVLLDLGLPDIHGHEVARTLRAQPESPILVALTGYGQNHDKEQSLAAGFDRHLTKPVSIDELEALFAALAAGTD